jgi:hypothetical protein
MRKTSKSLLLGFVLALIALPRLHAQTAASAPADTKPTAANAAHTGPAPADVMKKVSDLVHASKYAEARELTTGLLLAYPNDQRLIKAKVLLDKSLADASSANATSSSSQPAANAEQVSGMDKVDYNALIELARQAQQTTDLAQQKKLLQKFMDRSGLFLQKFPDQILLWQLRAATALSLNDPIAGYEAGQKLLAMDAADTNDPNLQRLLAQLKNKDWMDKQEVTKQEDETDKNGWILGTWTMSWSVSGKHGDYGKVVFSKSDSGDIEAYGQNEADTLFGMPFLRETIPNAGEIRWEVYLNPNSGCCPSGWQPVISYEIGNDKKTMKVLVPSQWGTEGDSEKGSRQQPMTYILAKIRDSQGQ